MIKKLVFILGCLVCCVSAILLSAPVYADTNLTDFYGWSLNGAMTWFNGSDNYSQTNIPLPASVNCFKIETLRDGSALCIDRTFDNLIFINKSDSFNYSLIPTGDDPLSLCLDREENVFIGSRTDAKFNFHNKSLGWYNRSIYGTDGVESVAGMCAFDLTDKYWLGGTAGDGMCFRTRDNFSDYECINFNSACDGREMNVDGNNSIWVTCGDASKIMNFVPDAFNVTNSTNYTQFNYGGYDEPVGIVPNLYSDILFVDYGNGGNGNQGTERLYWMNGTDNSSIRNWSVDYECYGVDVDTKDYVLVSNFNSGISYIELFNASDNYSKTLVSAPARTRNIAFATFRPDWYVTITVDDNVTNVTVNDTGLPHITIIYPNATTGNTSAFTLDGYCTDQYFDNYTAITSISINDSHLIKNVSVPLGNFSFYYNQNFSSKRHINISCIDNSSNTNSTTATFVFDVIPPTCNGTDTNLSIPINVTDYTVNVTCIDDEIIRYFYVNCTGTSNISFVYAPNTTTYAFNWNPEPFNTTITCRYDIRDYVHTTTYSQSLDKVMTFPDGSLVTGICPDSLTSSAMLWLGAVIGMFMIAIGFGAMGRKVPIAGIFGSLMFMFMGFTFIGCQMVMGYIVIMSSIAFIAIFSFGGDDITGQ